MVGPGQVTVCILLRCRGCRTGTCVGCRCFHTNKAQELAGTRVRAKVTTSQSHQQPGSRVPYSEDRSRVRSQAGVNNRSVAAIQNQKAENRVRAQAKVNKRKSGSNRVRRKAGSKHRINRKQAWSWLTGVEEHSAIPLSFVMP